MCSSAQEDFWRPVDYLSPLSTPDLTPRDDYTVPQVFREISSNLNGKGTMLLFFLLFSFQVFIACYCFILWFEHECVVKKTQL